MKSYRSDSGGMGIGMAIVLGTVALIALLFLAHLVLYPAGQATRIYEKTLDADNVIYNYEYFKKSYQDIQAMGTKLRTAQDEMDAFLKSAGDREKWDFRDKEEHARLAANVTGVKNVRADMVAEYNARSKMANRSIFRDRSLPEHIEQ